MYNIGQIENTVINGDCLVELDNIPDNSVDLVVFSPPYDNIRDYKNNWSFDFESLGNKLFRVVKDGGVAVVVIGDGTKNFSKSLTSFRLAVNWCDAIGWKLFETCIYKRDGNPGAWWKTRFRVDHEFVFIFFKGLRPKYFNKDHMMVPSKHAGKIYSGTDRLSNGDFKKIEPKSVNPLKDIGTIWSYATSNSERNKVKLLHPATFPDKLSSDIILAFSQDGDLILDPMCGSGTSCVMAKKNNRRYIGIEIAKEYCKIAKQLLLEQENAFVVQR